MSDIVLGESNPRLRIGFVHRFDARNIRSWSGIFYFMGQALEKHVGEVVYLGPDDSAGTKFLVDTIARINRVWRWITGGILSTDHNRILSHRLGRFFEKRLLAQPCDILFAPVASVEIANLRTTIPIVYYSDLTWNQIIEYYPDYSGISGIGKIQGEEIESSAILRSRAAAYPSMWAVESACSHYGASRDTTHHVSFGANLNTPPSRESALSRSVGASGQAIKLLLVGVDWERKGGPIAFECLKCLLESVDAELTILGCVPPSGFQHPKLEVIPFLSKHDPEQRQRIEQLFMQAHFMLLPTRADATPIVTCEASAFGLPTLASDTGGLRGSITEGVNGYLLPLEAGGRAYADKILEVIRDPERYRTLVASSRNEYESRLNWDAWAISMRVIMENVLNRKIDIPSHLNSSQPLPHSVDGVRLSDKYCPSTDSVTDLSVDITAEVSQI